MTRFARLVSVGSVAWLVLGALSGSATAASLNPGGIDKAPIVWLDASDPDADGIAKNNPTDGQSVDVWKDKSGNGNDAVVHPGQNPATYQTTEENLINGTPTLHFTRVLDWAGSVYKIPVDVRPGSMPDVTIFAVYKPTKSVPNNGIWGTDNGSWDRFYISYHPAFGDGVDDGVAALGPTYIGATVPNAGTPGVARLMTIRYDGDVVGGVNNGPKDASAVFFDGDVVVRFADTTAAWDAQSYLGLGWDGDNSVFDGDMAEFIVFPYALTDDEIRKVTSYLHTKLDVAKTPVTVSAQTGLRAITDENIYQLGFTTNPASEWSDWSTAPTCNAFALTDTTYSTPLTGQLARGHYLTHCSGGVSDKYTPTEYKDGTLKIVSSSGIARQSVFFPELSSDLTEEAKATLASMVHSLTRVQVTGVVVAGFVRPTKTETNDIPLSTARARAVADYLKTLGVTVEPVISGRGPASYKGAYARKATVWLRLKRQPHVI